MHIKKLTINIIATFCFVIPLWAQKGGVQISPKGGIYATAFPVTISCDNPNFQIRYTLNGSTPDGSATLYTNALTLNTKMCSKSDIYKILISPKNEFYLPSSVIKAIVIRAAAFDGQGNRVSPVVTQSYFINALGCDLHGLPVVSICADSLSLFAHDTGILVPGALIDPKDPDNTGNYTQHGREWERAVNVEFYADGNGGFNQMAGLRTHGGSRARRAQQKGLKIYARTEYGKKNFKCRIFEESELEKYKHLVLRPFRNSASPSGVNDWLANQIAAPLKMGTTASRPVVLFLNGEYWGIYFLGEKIDERYLENHYVVDCNNVNIISSWIGADAGTSDDWMALYNWLKAADLRDTAQYRYLSERIDISNIIDYFIFELYSANWDWPSNNARCWQFPGEPWRWLFYDGDCCFDNPEYDAYLMATFTGQYWSSCEWSTLFFRKLLESNLFKSQFLLRLDELNKKVLNYKRTRPYLEKIRRLLKDEIPMQVQRFGNPQSVSQWEESCQEIDHFLSVREGQFWQQTSDYFHLKNDKVSSVACDSKRTLSGKPLNLRVTAEEDCAAWMQVCDPKGRIIYGQYVFLHHGENNIPLKLGNRSGVYVVRVGDAVCKIKRISYMVPVFIFLSAISISFFLIFLRTRRKRKLCTFALSEN